MAIDQTARHLVRPGTGIMAADRPSPAFYDLLAANDIPSDSDSYRQWSQLLFPRAVHRRACQRHHHD